jgi:hypothetical protein
MVIPSFDNDMARAGTQILPIGPVERVKWRNVLATGLLAWRATEIETIRARVARW